MNLLRNPIKLICNKFENISLNISRGYAIQKPIPIRWFPPKKLPCIHPKNSGDNGMNLDISPNELITRFEKCKELENAPELVRKLYTLRFNPRKEMTLKRKMKVKQMVQKHVNDNMSMDCKIAKLSASILNQQEFQKKHPHCGVFRRRLKETIDRRNKFLRIVRKWDYKRYEYLLEKLNLVYKPFPEQFVRLTRKIGMRHLLGKWCDNVVKKKLDDYKAELDAQQKIFFKEKAEKLEFIRNEEIACGVIPTVSEEEVVLAKQKAAEIN